jgi:mannan endo-1,4-beta-mannosidase
MALGVACGSSDDGMSGGGAGLGDHDAASGGSQNVGGGIGTGGASGSGTGGSAGAAGGNTGGAGGGGGSSGAGGSAGTGGARADGGAPRDGGLSSDGAAQHATFYVDGRNLLDPCGNQVILRGINKMLVFTDRSCASCAEVAKTGANSIRMMWFTSVALSQAETAVNNAVKSGLIPILEMQDATCDALGASVDAIVDFWVQPASVAFLQKHQSHLIANIANEAGDAESATAFRTYYAGAVRRMRTAGIHVPLMIDANNCGRNGELLLSVAQGLMSDDPDHNLLFSMHWYDSGASQTARVTSVMETAVSQNVPFLIGEFSSTGVPQCTPTVPYKLVMSEAQRLGIGYLPWEWGPGNEDCKPTNGSSPMDMTSDSTFSTLQSGWAMDVTTTDPASIKNTSKRSPFIVNGSCQ